MMLRRVLALPPHAPPRKVDRWFRAAAARVGGRLLSLGHGGNDAQKTMGIIWRCWSPAACSTARRRSRRRPGSILVVPRGDGARHAVRRLAHRQDDGHEASPSCKPVGGFCAETGGAITLFVATRARHPGVDDAHDHRRDRRRRLDATQLSAVRWGVAGRIVWAWIFTIPASAGVAAGCYKLSTYFTAR